MRLFKPFMFLCGILALPQCVNASTYHGFAWNIVADTPAIAQGWTYRIYLDGAAMPGPSGVVLTNVSCALDNTVSPAVILCSGSMVPPPGQHTANITSGDSESEVPSADPAITFIQGPSRPTKVKAKP